MTNDIRELERGDGRRVEGASRLEDSGNLEEMLAPQGISVLGGV